MIVNLNDRSTPIGTLCWALWEIVRMTTIHTMERMANHVPGLEIVYPTNYDPYYTILDAMTAVSKPEIVSIVDDPRLSEEANLFAKALFANVAATLEQAEEVGIDEVDGDKLPYSDLNPYMDKFHDAHPDECIEPDIAVED